MEELLLESGVVGILIVLLYREYTSFKNTKSNNSGGWKGKFLDKQHEELKTLMISVNANITAQTKILTEVCKELKKVKEKINI